MLRLLVSLSVAGIAGLSSVSASDNRPPTLVEGSQLIPAPEQARKIGVEGPVQFRARIGAEGEFESVEILSVPGENLGFEEATAEALGQWRFSPARRDGRNVAGVFEGKIEFIDLYAVHRARVYRSSSEKLWNAVVELLKERKIKTRVREDGDGLIITKMSGVKSKRFAGLEIVEVENLQAQFVEMHIFVPRGRTPGRLHVGTVTKFGGDAVRYVYHLPSVAYWFFDEIDRRVGERGLVIPKRPSMRQQMLEGLTGVERRRCPMGAFPQEPISNPQRIAKSHVKPMYPGMSVANRESGKLVIQTVVDEVGFVSDAQILHSPAPDSELEISAVQSILLWRYRPAMIDGCAVPVFSTVIVDFNLR